MSNIDENDKKSLFYYIDLWNREYEKHIVKFENKPLLKLILEGIAFVIVCGLGVIVLTLIWAAISFILAILGVNNNKGISLFILIGLFIIFIVASLIKQDKKNKMG